MGRPGARALRAPGGDGRTLMGALLDTPWSGQSFAPPTPLDIATVENAIVTELRAAIGTGLEVVHFPDRPISYRLTHRIGAALIAYRGATYGGLLDTGVIVQERRLEFEVAVVVRDLGWAVGGDPDGASPGAYAILEAVRAALTGFLIPGARKMFPLREGFVERDRQGGVWIYSITFALVTVALETSASPGFPLFVKGIAAETGGETAITVGAAPYTFSAQDQIQLPNGNVLALTVSALSGAAYSAGTDFTLDAANGIVTRLASGTIAPGATVSVAYSYGETAVAVPGASAPAA